MIFADRQAQSLAAEGITVEPFYLMTRTSFRGLIAEAKRFRSRLRQFRPQVVHAHFGTVTGLFAAVAGTGYPLVITYRGGDLNPAPTLAPWNSKFRSSLARLLSQLAALRTDRIVCVIEQLRGRLWWRQDCVVVLPSGVDANLFHPQKQDEARRRLDWNADQRIVLFNAGGPWWIKRPDLARGAVQYAQRSIPRLRLVLVDGTVAPGLMPAWMNAADCLLLTSDTEGSPTVIQEALACGLPIVAVNVGDTVDRLRGVEGVRIAARDPRALGAALTELLSAAGRRSTGPLMVKEFSAQRIAAQLSKIYKKLADAG